MRQKYLVLFIAAIILFSCKKEKGTTLPSFPPPPAPTVLLKDVVVNNLPSPYYHFEYNTAGKPSFVSFASGFFMYNILYQGDKISELKNNIVVNKDGLKYFYDNADRVNAIWYTDSTGLVFTKINLSYNGSKLIKLERQRKMGADFIVDKTMTLSYHPDGNLLDLTVHYAATAAQNEITFTDRYEQYDNKINAEGFSLLHNEFFDHFVFLPGVQLQKNNPGRVTRTGDGTNSITDYTYTYDDHQAPLTRSGNFVFTNGANAGQVIHLGSIYTYYP